MRIWWVCRPVLPRREGGQGLSKRYLGAILDATRAGSSTIDFSGIEPGFGCDLFPVALMTMSHTVYSVRRLEGRASTATDEAEGPT
jgi:hypothetical protein